MTARPNRLLIGQQIGAYAAHGLSLLVPRVNSFGRKALASTVKTVADKKERVLEGYYDAEEERILLHKSLAEHAERVFRTLVTLVGSDDRKTSAKLGDLAQLYLPRPEEPERELPVAEPEDFCAALRGDLGLAAAVGAVPPAALSDFRPPPRGGPRGAQPAGGY